MKKTSLIILGVLWLGLGCGTIKSWLNKEPHDEFAPPPPQEQVEVDENGNPVFTDNQLKGGSPSTNWFGAVMLVGFLVVTGLIVRQSIKNKNKE